MCDVLVCPAGVAPLKVEMPALSPTMEEGNIVKWLKKEGECLICVSADLTDDVVRVQSCTAAKLLAVHRHATDCFPVSSLGLVVLVEKYLGQSI